MRIPLGHLSLHNCPIGAYVSVALEAVPPHDPRDELKVWLCGRMHTPRSRRIGGVEYVALPRGFPQDRHTPELAAYRAARVTATGR